MEQQNIRINNLLASHVWEPQPTSQVGTVRSNLPSSRPHGMDAIECWVRHGAHSRTEAGKGELLVLPNDTAAIDI